MEESVNTCRLQIGIALESSYFKHQVALIHHETRFPCSIGICMLGADLSVDSIKMALAFDKVVLSGDSITQLAYDQGCGFCFGPAMQNGNYFYSMFAI